MKKISFIQNMIRIVGIIQLVMGIIFWTGNADSLVICHIILGTAITVGMIILSVQAAKQGVSQWLVIIGFVWAIGLPAWGLFQDKIFPGSYHWITEVLHLLCGLGAIGMSEILSMNIKKRIS